MVKKSKKVENMDWQRVTLFISSTFNDFHGERDYLIKTVFPELRNWCEERKIHLVDVDLRWGVTNDDTENANTVGACLKNIDKSRPFFLCFLGQRRGWIPNPEEDISDYTMEIYPDIKDLVKNRSITEIEVEHALLNPMHRLLKDENKADCPTVKHALFFFREARHIAKSNEKLKKKIENYTEILNPAQKCIYTNQCEDNPTKADKKLEKFKEEILRKEKEAKIANKELQEKVYKKEKIVPQTPELKKEIKKLKKEMLYLKVNSYFGVWNENHKVPELKHMQKGESYGGFTDFKINGESLKDVIINQLKDQIAIAFPKNMEINEISELQKELDQQDLFREINTQGFIPRKESFNELDNYLNCDKNGLCILTAEAGLGKTMLLANYLTEIIKNGNLKVYGRFSGVSDKSGEQYDIWKTLLEEAKVSNTKIKNEIKN